jgi:hypothetical protein
MVEHLYSKCKALSPNPSTKPPLKKKKVSISKSKGSQSVFYFFWVEEDITGVGAQNGTQRQRESP